VAEYATHIEILSSDTTGNVIWYKLSHISYGAPDVKI